jgi:hypothetical protein
LVSNINWASAKQAQWVKCGTKFDTFTIQCPIGEKNQIFFTILAQWLML